MLQKTIAVFALLASWGVSAQGASYSTAFLNPFGGKQSAAYAINDQGVVIGRATLDNNVNEHGFVWTNGVAVSVGTLGGPHSYAYGLNNASTVVGHSFRMDTFGGAFRWEAGTLQNLDPDPASTGWHFSQAHDINEAGAIVGSVSNHLQFPFARNQAVLLRAGVTTVLAPSAGEDSWATAINDNNVAVGYSSGYVATLWQGGLASSWEPKSLMSLGFGSTMAHDINNAGLIVGESRTSFGYSVAVTWQGEQIIRLQGLTEGNASAYAVNESGQVVGYSSIAHTGGRAVLWQDGEVTDLNLRLSESERASGWTLTVARDINESGWIVGEAFNSKLGLNSAFVMSVIPAVPEPSTSLMLFAGVGLLGLAAARKQRS